MGGSDRLDRVRRLVPAQVPRARAVIPSRLEKGALPRAPGPGRARRLGDSAEVDVGRQIGGPGLSERIRGPVPRSACSVSPKPSHAAVVDKERGAAGRGEACPKALRDSLGRSADLGDGTVGQVREAAVEDGIGTRRPPGEGEPVGARDDRALSPGSSPPVAPGGRAARRGTRWRSRRAVRRAVRPAATPSGARGRSASRPAAREASYWSRRARSAPRRGKPAVRRGRAHGIAHQRAPAGAELGEHEGIGPALVIPDLGHPETDKLAEHLADLGRGR